MSFTYPSAEEVSLASLESVAVLETGPRNEVLHDVSFWVEPGQMVALVGPSGAGKTTISNLVPRLYDVTAGSVRLSGIDVRHATMASVRDVVGVVTQDPHLFHDTLRANLLYARPEATEAEVLEALEQAQIGHLVGELPDGLDTVIGERGYRLSGGEKQRVALARLHAQGARHRGPRRGDGAPRLGVRGGGPARAARDAGRAHVPRDRPPALHRAGGRRAPRHRRRPHRRAGHPRQPAGRQRPLRRALPHPVRRPGRGARGHLVGRAQHLGQLVRDGRELGHHEVTAQPVGAVDDQGVARHEGGVGRAEPGHGPAQLVQAAEATGRRPAGVDRLARRVAAP